MLKTEAGVYSIKLKDRYVTIISNNESASVLIQGRNGIQSYVLPRNTNKQEEK